MSRRGRWLILSAALLTGLLFLVPRSASRRCFATREEALQYVLARLLAADQTDSAGDPYASTYTRSYKSLTGEQGNYFLVAPPERELALAEGFETHGFHREALAHLENLVAYYPETPEGRSARERLAAVRQKTVLGLVPSMSVVLKDSNGRRYVSVVGEPPRKPGLDRIEAPYLEQAEPAKGGLETVGFIDDAGSILSWRREAEEFPVIFEPAEPSEPLTAGSMAREGAVAAGRKYYALYGNSLFSSERQAKGRLLDELPDCDAPLSPEQLAECRRASDALIYLGRRDEAIAMRIRMGEPINPTPLEGGVDTIAADPNAPLHLDALWRLKLRELPKFTLSTKSAVTTGSELPLQIDATGISEMTFSLATFEGPMPSTEQELKAWLPQAPVRRSHTLTLPIAAGKSSVALPIREAGGYRVTAEARGLSCSFLAVRTDLSLEVFAFPGQRFMTASRGGVTIASLQQPLGTTDADGFLVPAAPGRVKICEEHRGCCAGCESCEHHHGDGGGSMAPNIFVTGHGQFFRAAARLDLAELGKVSVLPPAPLLFLHTDRPAYKAGDDVKFRGILRIPKTPLLRKDPARLLPATDREVAVAIRCGENTLFSRTYVTGDHGTFQGEFTLPLAAVRAEYALVVSCEGAETVRPFHVLDYRKTDYAVLLTPEAGGIRIQAGYVWGAPVSGTVVKCRIDGRETPVVQNFVSARDGESVQVELWRGEEELARKTLVFRERAAEATPAPALDPAPAPPAQAAGEAPGTTAPLLTDPLQNPTFTVKTNQALYRREETIEVEIESPWKEEEAIVVVGDVQLYDLVRVPIRNGKGKASIPVRAIHDPGVTVFALCRGALTKTPVQVRANRMAVDVAAPGKGRPGEEVDVTVTADPKSAVALSAVDEAIYMIREDDTPEIYSFFHPARPAALAYGRFEGFEYDGETHPVELLPVDPRFRKARWVGRRLFRGDGLYDTMGVGVGGGSGGVYGGRADARMLRVAAGGATKASESAVLASIRALSARQQPDGSWPTGMTTEAGALSPVGATGLALLSYLGAGYSQLSKDEYPDPTNPGRLFKMGEIVKKGLQWLLSHQGADGFLGAGSGDRILNHAIGALALSEAYGMTASAPLLEPAQAAINSLASRQSGNGGWHRSESTRAGEVLTSAFAVMALKSAQLSELTMPGSSPANALGFFTGLTGENGLPGATPTRAEVGGWMLAKMFLRRDKGDATLTAGASWLVNRVPSWEQGDFLGWYLTSLALFQYDGPDGPLWKLWHQPSKDLLLPRQAQDGSWAVGADSVIPTALGTLILQVYYRYVNVFGGAGSGVGGGSGGRREAPLVPAPRVRVYFPDTVYWAPELITDEKGEARVSFRLPEQITTTRLTARGITRTGAAGQTVARIATEQRFFVKIQAPEFAVLDDEIEVRADVYNYTNAGLDAEIRLEGSEEVRKARVPTDRPATVSWRVRASDPAGLRLAVHAVSGAHQDSMERTLPVRRVGREAPVTVRGKSETGGSFRFDAPKGVQDLAVRIRPKSGNLTQVLDALRYLNEYPYG